MKNWKSSLNLQNFLFDRDNLKAKQIYDQSFFYTDTHNFHPELTLEWQDGFVSNSLACFLTDTYGIISIMHRV